MINYPTQVSAMIRMRTFYCNIYVIHTHLGSRFIPAGFTAQILLGSVLCSHWWSGPNRTMQITFYHLMFSAVTIITYTLYMLYSCDGFQYWCISGYIWVYHCIGSSPSPYQPIAKLVIVYMLLCMLGCWRCVCTHSTLDKSTHVATATEIEQAVGPIHATVTGTLTGCSLKYWPQCTP